jgi:endonuclease/exonuclease/phosphatase family metal-dependent hydrolase
MNYSPPKIFIVFSLALVLLLTGGCLVQPVPPVPSPRPGETPSSAGFLQKPSPSDIRVMSFNVNWDSIFPDNDPQNDRLREYSRGAAFARILQAVRPDVLCLNEINPVRDPQQVGDILDSALPLENGRKWQTFRGKDDVLAARFDLRMGTDQLVHGSAGTLGQAAALVDLPDAEYKTDLYMICAHFKASGGQGNIQARQKQADAIIAWIADAETPGDKVDLPADTPVIVLGDLNVYDTDPAHHLTTLLTGDIENEKQYGPDSKPDWDGTDLADTLPHHNGTGQETYTWRDDTQEFNPGALDRILYTDSVASVENGFVLDTMEMPEDQLASAGLQPGDVMLDPAKGIYDHLPLAVDFSFHDLSKGQ